MPFPNTSLAGLERAILRCELSFKSPYWSLVSETGKKFITALIHADQKTRPTAADALAHSWLSPPSSTSRSLEKARSTEKMSTSRSLRSAPSSPDLPGLRENVNSIARARWRAALVSSLAVARLREAGQQAERRRTETEQQRERERAEREREKEHERSRSLSLSLNANPVETSKIAVTVDSEHALPPLPPDALAIIERWSCADIGVGLAKGQKHLRPTGAARRVSSRDSYSSSSGSSSSMLAKTTSTRSRTTVDPDEGELDGEETLGWRTRTRTRSRPQAYTVAVAI